MAHVVGVPKRDPCQKCNLPVFLAERLMVGKKVYHRTCLKCARCGSQLTPGSFYETEVDDEFCCETCPDEEVGGFEVQDSVLMRSANVDSRNETDSSEDDPSFASAAAPSANVIQKSKAVRSSIADRLAFFEHNQDGENKLLKKSLSDEEKSKNLNKMNEILQMPSHKISAAQAHFMTSILKDDDADADDDNDITDSLSGEVAPTSSVCKSETSKKSSSNNSDSEDDESENKVELRSDRISNLLKTTTEIIPFPNQNEYNILGESTESTSSSEINPSNASHQPIIASIDKANIIYTDDMNNIVLSDETTEDNVNKTENIIFVNELNDKIVVTKDDVQMRTNVTNETNIVVCKSESSEEEIEKENEASVSDGIMRKQFSLDQDTTNRLSVVRARLHQFEGIANNITEKSTLSVNFKTHNNNKVNKHEIIINNYKDDTTCALDAKDNENFDMDCKDNVKFLHEKETQEKGGEEDKKVPINDEKPKTDADDNDDKIIMSIKRDEENSAENLSECLFSSSNSSNKKDDPPNEVVLTNEIEKSNDVNIIVTNSEKQSIVVNDTIDELSEINSKQFENHENPSEIIDSGLNNTKLQTEEYPEDLNPFKSDEENEENPSPSPIVQMRQKEDSRKSLNPFDSSDDEIEMEKKVKPKPPRPPPPRISKNPFGSESDDEESSNKIKGFDQSGTIRESKRPPVPTPRTNVSLSQNPTPEPTPRLSAKQSNTLSPTVNRPISSLNNFGDYYGSSVSLGTPLGFQRNSSSRESTNSCSSSASTLRSRKSRKGPAPPPPVKELFPSTETIDSKFSTPNSSNSTTPSQVRKKRPAPAPPKPARLDANLLPKSSSIDPKNLNSYPLQSDLDKLSDEEKVLLEGKGLEDKFFSSNKTNIGSARRVIPLDFSIVEDANSDDMKHKEEDNVVYRRTIIPHQLETPTHQCVVTTSPEKDASHDRQLEKIKDNKEANNRNRQSQISSSGAEDVDLSCNKSSHGKWKRRKGPAPLPALPVPPRKILQMLPLQEIKHELEIIEVQQQGLEKQGVILEKMIRDRCEGQNGEPLDKERTDGNGNSMQAPNSKEVEDLILQLFELVNEKNELFRRQAELMYLRRQHRLEQEQADIEYEIRVLMAQPERNKTDSDKAREETLIGRLVKIVQLRNEVVDCLEMDRLREAEEDLSIKQRLELHAAKREEELQKRTLTKLSKKEKRKLKEAKKLGKKKLDADKDADESEINVDKQKMKKKKKHFLF